MSDEELKNILSIVSEAQDIIFCAKSCYDKRKKDKLIREAKSNAQDMVLPYRTLLEEELDFDLNVELFSWWFLERDLQDVHKKLTERINCMSNTI